MCSSDLEELPEWHLKLIASMGSPLSLAYMQLTDRRSGRTHPAPIRWVGLEKPAEQVMKALEEAGDLVWYDGRHQLWIRGAFGEQLVLDELGVLYCYPDDPSFRDALTDLPEASTTGMDARDYVKVFFRSEADTQEEAFLRDLGMVRMK